MFLTDRRREVLNGEFQGNPETLSSHKSRIRTRSRMALSELVEVAQSPEIHNSDVFEPEQVDLFIESILNGPIEEEDRHHILARLTRHFQFPSPDNVETTEMTEEEEAKTRNRMNQPDS